MSYTDPGNPVAFDSLVTELTGVDKSYEVFSRKNKVIFSFHSAKSILSEVVFLCIHINKKPRRA